MFSLTKPDTAGTHDRVPHHDNLDDRFIDELLRPTIATSRCAISFELFPPKTEAGSGVACATTFAA